MSRGDLPKHVHLDYDHVERRVLAFHRASEWDQRTALAWLASASVGGEHGAISAVAIAGGALGISADTFISSHFTGWGHLTALNVFLLVALVCASTYAAVRNVINGATRRSTATFWLDLYTRELADEKSRRRRR